MDTTIKCPKCGEEFSIADVLSPQKEKYEEQLKVAQQQEIEARKRKNELDEKLRNLELDKQRQIDIEREKWLDSQKYRFKEYEKVIEDLKKSNEDAIRKANQGSQQLQGEVQELDLENELKNYFQGDEIAPIGKGILGADIRQTVKSPKGRTCGVVLWESKRTKAWSDQWIVKLKEDALKDKADLCAIVSETLPEFAKNGIGQTDGVWVCLPKLALVLSALLRKSLLDSARQQAIMERKQDASGHLYDYVTSNEFSQIVESMVQTYQNMLEQVNKERTAYERLWKQREMDAQKLLTGISGMYGSIGAITPNLPPIKILELE